MKNVRQNIRDFNIERARLEVALPMYYMSNVVTIAYGWVMARKVSGRAYRPLVHHRMVLKRHLASVEFPNDGSLARDVSSGHRGE